MSPDPPIETTRRWLLWLPLVLALFTVAYFLLFKSWWMPAVYWVLFTPLWIRVFLHVRREQ
jgi:hypothetical protein